MPIPVHPNQAVGADDAAAIQFRQSGEQALAEARRFHDELLSLRSAGTLTEARETELNTSYDRAYQVYERNAAMLEGSLRMRRLAARQDAESAEEPDEIEVRHPRASVEPESEGGTPIDPSGQARGARRTVDGIQEERLAPQAMVRRAFSLEVALRRMRDKPGMRSLLDRCIRERKGDALSQIEMRAIDPYRDTEGHWGIGHEVSAQVIRQIRDQVHIMGAAKVIPTSKASIAFPTFYYRGAGLAAHRMGAVYGEKSFRDILGMTEFVPQARGNTLSVPEELVEDPDYPLLEHLGEEMAFDSGEQKEQLFLTGNGKGEPLGILHSSVPLADYETAGSALAADDVKGFIYNLSAARRQGAEWMLGRAALKLISKFREDSGASAGTGNYMFRAGLEDKDGPRLIGLPVMESEWYPDGTASGAAAGTSIALLGNWYAGYWIVMRLALTVKRLAESKDDAGNVVFKYRERYTGAPVRLDMFANLTKKA